MKSGFELILENADGELSQVECGRFAIKWQGKEIWVQHVGDGQLLMGVEVEEEDSEYANLVIRPLATNLMSLQLEMDPADAEEHVHGPDCNHWSVADGIALIRYNARHCMPNGDSHRKTVY